MRLWHQSLLPYLSTQRLLSQHRECCALRGNGWGRKHATVQYVFNHSYYYLVMYHRVVMNEMQKRGYHVDWQWEHGQYRGKHCEEWPTNVTNEDFEYLAHAYYHNEIIYPEHNIEYLCECIKLLRQKGDKQTLNNLYGKPIQIEDVYKPIKVDEAEYRRVWLEYALKTNLSCQQPVIIFATEEDSKDE